MKMGYAETDITPEMPVTMVGFNRTDNISRGILDHLMAQVSVWEDNEISCLVTIDNIGFNKRDANLLRDRIGTSICVPREKVMLSFSHTHAAPNTHVEREYYEMLCEKICRAAEAARSSMSKVAVCWGNAAADIGNNRRDSSDAIPISLQRKNMTWADMRYILPCCYIMKIMEGCIHTSESPLI